MASMLGVVERKLGIRAVTPGFCVRDAWDSVSRCNRLGVGGVAGRHHSHPTQIAGTVQSLLTIKLQTGGGDHNGQYAVNITFMLCYGMPQ